jgi:DNA polymerase III alpha subunit
MAKYQFPCGCEFEIVGPSPVQGGLPLLDFDAYAIRPDCSATWELLSRGRCKGVFQLESPLGKQWSKQLKPREMEHMSALGALLRPGALKAEVEPGLTMTKLYCQRLNGEVPVTSFHPALDPILASTYQVLVYQEQSMRIGRELAGFDLKEVDRLRKAIGKKDEKEMSAVGELFLARAKEKGVVPYEVAETVWGWIKKSGRYQFNHSHSLSYGVIGYITAYIKTHFPVQFFWSWLRYAQEKSEPMMEIAELVNDAKLFDVPVMPPDIRSLKKRFSTNFLEVRFGMSDVKNIGNAQIAKIREAAAEATKELDKPISGWSWYEALTCFTHRAPASTIERLISVGSFDHLGNGLRTLHLEEFRLWTFLTDKERDWIRKRRGQFDSLLPAVKALAQPRKPAKGKLKKGEPEPVGPFGGCANDNRQQAVASRVLLLEHPPTPLEDLPNWVARTEAELLGAAATCSEVDGLDQRDVNCTCKEFQQGHNGHYGTVILGVKIENQRTITCKRGKSAGRKMAYLTISDASCALSDVVVFPDAWFQFQEVLVENNCVILQGERDRKSDQFIVKKAYLM